MPSFFLSSKDNKICAVSQEKEYSVYCLNDMQDLAFYHYKRQDVRFDLIKDLPLEDQPFGQIGYHEDLSGRKVTFNSKLEKYPKSDSKELVLKDPIYTFLGKFPKDTFKKRYKEFRPETDFGCYACITIESYAVGDAGDDKYIRKLFFLMSVLSIF